jgi:flagellar hook-length control protein FliK
MIELLIMFYIMVSNTVGWGCYQMGFSRKAEDPEPGRCRRTDGKKWRCSKEAYPDSKYCEKHMHRGKNRSRKPVEMPLASSNPNPHPSPTSASSANSATRTSSSPYASSLSMSTPQPYNHLLYQSQINSSSSSSHFNNASSYYSSDRDYRSVYSLTSSLFVSWSVTGFLLFFWFISF